MRIDRIEIASFGKLSNYELNLGDGFQVVYGHNEYGKSTIMAFIKMMFYSKLGQGRDIDKNMRLKYQPWDGAPMEGAIDFNNHGVNYRLQKRIGATAAKDKIELINKSTGATIPLSKNEEVGMYLIGLNLNEFERSGYIGQIGGFSSGTDADELSERILSNVITSGDESISQTVVLGHLNSAIEDMESKSKKKGMLVETQKNLEDLKAEKIEAERLCSLQKETAEKLSQIEALISRKNDLEILREKYKTSSQLEKLNALIAETEACENNIQQLLTESFTYESLIIFSNERIKDIDDIEAGAKGLAALESSQPESDMDAAAVTEEEYRDFKAKISERTKQENLLKSLRTDFKPAHNDYKIMYGKLMKALEIKAEAHEKLKQLKPFYDKYEETNQLLTGIKNKKEQKTQEYTNKKVIWDLKTETVNANEKIAKEEAEFWSDENLHNNSMQEKSTLTVCLLLLGGIVGILSIILSVLVQPLFMLLLIIAFIFAAAAFIVRKGKKIQPRHSNEKEQAVLKLSKVQQQRQELELAQDLEENTCKQEINNLIQQIAACEKTLTELEVYYKNYVSLQSAYENEMTGQVNQFQIYCEARKETLDKRLYGIQSKYKEILEQSTFFSDIYGHASEELDEFITKLQQIVDLLSKDIQMSILKKGCNNEQEYENNYISFSSNKKNQISINKIKDKINDLKIKFVNEVTQYKAADDYNQAKEIVNNLHQKLEEIDSQRFSIQKTAEGREILDHSLSSLQAARKSLEEKLAERQTIRLDENITGLTELEIIDQIEKLNFQDLNGQQIEITKSIKTPERDIATIEREITLCTQELEEKNRYFDCLHLAKEVMEEAGDEMRQNFAPELNRITEDIFGELTNGKYEKVLISKDFNVRIRSGIHLREWRYLSSGTIDQVYLSLRLAISELISKKNNRVPILLDDSLMQYDDERLVKALTFLEDYANRKDNRCQIILFTCHNHIASLVLGEKKTKLS